MLPRGWSVAGWTSHLRHIADACEKYHPGRADELRKAAREIENENTKRKEKP